MIDGLIEIRGLGSKVARAMVRRWAAGLSDADADWPALRKELDLWRGSAAKFWWRDDDAVGDTPGLRHLLALRDRYQVPLAIAAIPAVIEPSLNTVLRDWPGVEVFAHGWNHHDYSSSRQPSGELVAGRDAAKVTEELSLGRIRLEDMFRDKFRPTLVPPHNYIAPGLVEAVRQAGFSFLSVDGDFVALPIPCANVHVDVIDWRHKRAASVGQVVRNAVAALRLRRFGLVEASTPIGLITHHLVHDAQVWDITATFLNCLETHPSATFPDLNEIFRG